MRDERKIEKGLCVRERERNNRKKELQGKQSEGVENER